MSALIPNLQQAASAAIKAHYEVDVPPETFNVQETRKDFEGELTIVTFPLSKFRLGAPHVVGEELGKLLVRDLDYVEAYNVVKGFLNLSISAGYWLSFLAEQQNNPDFFRTNIGEGNAVVVEYCSPNTNKPLHMGHLRNIVLGYALSQILKANGYKTHEVCLYNDRGTAISKSMYSWEQSGLNETPESSGKKGDVLVGDYYVAFGGQYQKEIETLVAEGMPEAEAKVKAPSHKAINDMLIAWEAQDPATRALWKKMNQWVYDAHMDTFQHLGINFEKFYYESDLYNEGKDIVEEGIQSGVFYKKEDGSVWIDLEEEGLDQKLVLRANGTSIYITQDLATAAHKQGDFDMQKSIYVVGNEQDYHFKVLFEILKKLKKPYANGLFHLSYGMVELPKGQGRIKSREGTRVDADDLIAEVQARVKEVTEDSEKIASLNDAEKEQLYRQLSLGALKFFLAKVDPQKRMIFDPKESVALKGHTGPYIQYAYARTQSILRNAGEFPQFSADSALEESLQTSERNLLLRLFRFPDTLSDAGAQYNPALIANYAYELARDFSSFYDECKVIQQDKAHTSAMRLALVDFTGKTLQASMNLLGIEMPNRM